MCKVVLKANGFFSIVLVLAVSVHANAGSFDFGHVFQDNKEREFSGVVVVAKGNESNFKYVGSIYGKGRSASDKVNIASEFLIGSVSKQITASIILRLVDEKKIDLDDPIGEHIPTLERGWKSEVSIRSLLNHTSGIVSLDGELGFKPFSKFEYSNLNYDLLGVVASNVARKPYAELAKEVFAYCGMEHTYANFEPASKSMRLNGYAENILNEYQLVAGSIKQKSLPSAGFVSSAQDLVLWAQCLNNSDLISAEMHDEMVKPAAVREHRWGKLGYGFAMQISKDNGVLEWSHSGYVPGFISTLSYYPKQNITMVILENTSWNLSDMSRVFYYHDELRKHLVDEILSSSVSID